MPGSLLLVATALTVILLRSTIDFVAAMNPQTVCPTSQLDWYTDVVGETPCVTYQRLRQICNNDYQVGVFNPNTPGDTCNDQVSACCCNSISFALSMLCMNCQYDTLSSDIGIDAGKGTYGLYLDNCGPGSNQTLPTDVQEAVCNKDIKIDDNLYTLFWNDGTWFYVYTKETMEVAFSATNNNSFTHCASTLVNTTESAPPSSSTQSVTPSSSTQSTTSIDSSTVTPFSSKTTTSINTSTETTVPTASAAVLTSRSKVGPIVGGVLGSVLGVAAIGLVLFCFLRKQRQNSGKEYHNVDASRSVQDAPHVASYMKGSVATNPYLSSLTGFPSAGTRSSPVSGSSTTDTDSSYTYSTSQHTMSSSGGGYEADQRHEDGGPVTPALQRSKSGKPPPAYQSWELGYSAPDEFMKREEGPIQKIGGSGNGRGGAGGNVMGLPVS